MKKQFVLIVLAFAAGAIGNNVVATKVLRMAEERRLEQINLLADIIHRYADYADDDVNEKVGEETNFALALAGIEVPSE